MTNREIKIQELRKKWAKCLIEIHEKTQELWKLGTREKEIAKKLSEYGEEDFQPMAGKTTDLD